MDKANTQTKHIWFDDFFVSMLNSFDEPPAYLILHSLSVADIVYIAPDVCCKSGPSF